MRMQPIPHSKEGYQIVAPGFDKPWLLYPVAAVCGAVAVWIVVAAVLRLHSTALFGWVVLGWFVITAVLWYFIIGRIPDRMRVAAIRAQVPSTALILAARPRHSAEVWVGETMRSLHIRGRVPIGMVLVTTPHRLEVWMGMASAPGPVAFINWADVGAISVRPSHGGDVRFELGSVRLQVDFRLVSPRRFGTVIAYGHERARLIEELESVRVATVAKA